MRPNGRKWIAGSLMGTAMAVGLVASAASWGSSQAPDPKDKLDIWEGHWKFQTEYKSTPYTKAGSEGFDAVCSWTPNRGYMICDYISDRPDAEEGVVVNHLSIFDYSESEKTYKHLGISKEGKPLAEPATVEGNVWSSQAEVNAGKGKKVLYRDTYDFVTPEKQNHRGEVSADGGKHWTVVVESNGIKVH